VEEKLIKYIKEVIKQYVEGSPWAHGYAIGHKISKYNDPNLLLKTYDAAAKDGFKKRPKGRLSNPRGYTLNEDKDCNCGCGNCEETLLREHIRNRLTKTKQFLK